MNIKDFIKLCKNQGLNAWETTKALRSKFSQSQISRAGGIKKINLAYYECEPVGFKGAK